MGPRLNIVIVGGGTAGWMCAAALIHGVGPGLCDVRLIESDEIGTVGVGEATLPQIKDFNDFLGLDEVEFMSRTQATFKLGIEFVDWGFEGSSYIHPFGAHGQPVAGVPFHHWWLKGRALGVDHSIEDYAYAIAACRRNRFDFPAQDRRSVRSTYAYAYHFDASLYAGYLREFAEARGLKRTEGKIVEVIKHPEDGRVAAVRLESGEAVAGDLFIDCSGFRSLLLGQALGVEFESWRRWLPCDRALAAPCESAGELTPYTRSTACEAGWRWRIPLQHRTGNGYVFASDLITPEAAAESLMASLDGAPLGEPRLLRFEAGRRKLSWSKNCVALGLSSGFLEPLESTSIYLIQIAILNLIRLLPQPAVDPALASEFNRLVDMEYERVRDFLILHYHANTRADAPLWVRSREMEVPDSLIEKIENFRRRGHIRAHRDGLFAPPSWLSVFLGQGIEPERYDRRLDAVDEAQVREVLDGTRGQVLAGVEAMPAHADFVAGYCPARPEPRPVARAG